MRPIHTSIITFQRNPSPSARVVVSVPPPLAPALAALRLLQRNNQLLLAALVDLTAAESVPDDLGPPPLDARDLARDSYGYHQLLWLLATLANMSAVIDSHPAAVTIDNFTVVAITYRPWAFGYLATARLAGGASLISHGRTIRRARAAALTNTTYPISFSSSLPCPGRRVSPLAALVLCLRRLILRFRHPRRLP
jgi:hypothetical protein